jgi:hypothetical protein
MLVSRSRDDWRLVVLSLLKLGLLQQKVRCAALNDEEKQQVLGPTKHGEWLYGYWQQ